MILIVRAVLYFLCLFVLLLEPAVFVSFDRLGWGLYFFLIPLSSLLALIRGRKKYYPMGFILILFVLAFPGFSREGLIALMAGAYAFLSTILVRERKITWFLKGEMFLLASLFYRMLLFSYSSPDAALAQNGFGEFLFFLLIFTFLLYGGVIFLNGSKPFVGRKGEFVPLGAGAVILILFSLLLGADGVAHDIIPETVNEPLSPRLELMDLSTNSPLNGGNLRGQENLDSSGRTGQTPGEGEPGQEGASGEPKLLGVPGNSWQEALSSSQGDGEQPRQYAVMIVESERDATYMASRYFTDHEWTEGFTVDPDNYLNGLAQMRFVETWKNSQIPSYTGREAVHVSALSVEAEKGIPYFPYMVEPTVNDRRYYPFIYSWQSLSLITNPKSTIPLNFIKSYPSPLPEEAENALELDLPDSMVLLLDKILDSLELEGLGPYKKLQAILNMYSRYQYTMGFTEDWGTEHTMDFLVRIRQGDCTEFSNGAALLARRAGIPTRVVTGYLASDGLQTPNHRQALLYLREQIPPLQDKDPQNLYLVTTSHRHAWIQCWFPNYGWIDFETTAQAIPPSGSGDPNELDVVIPVITETVKGKSRFIFPWRPVLRVLAAAALVLLFAAYLSKALFKGYLRRMGRIPGEKGYKARYRLLLIRWTDRGYPPREKQMTPREYGELCPELKELSEAFIRGVYRSGAEAGRDEWSLFTEEYRRIFREDRSLIRGMRELISMKGLYYAIRSR